LACARAALSALPTAQVLLDEAPLDSAEYVALVRRVDVLVVPYAAHEYARRSSGVLAEGLAAGVPVVVPRATWMADQLQPSIQRWHLALRDRAIPLTLLAEAGRQQPLPREASHLLVRLRWPPAVPIGRRAEVRVEWRSASGDDLGHASAMLSRAPNAPNCSMLISAHPSAAAFCVQVRAADDPECSIPSSRASMRATPRLPRMCAVEGLRLDPSLPQSAVGVVASARPRDLAAAVREIVEHHAHYRSTATEFAAAWRQMHAPSALVDRLLERASHMRSGLE
jgi:hypothetical protein